MRASRILLLCASLGVAGCSAGPETPSAAARAYLEAGIRGDHGAARKVAVAGSGLSTDDLELVLRSRFARTHAKARVAREAVKRFGPDAARAFPLSRSATADLQALESASIETEGDTATIRVGRAPLVARRTGMLWWKAWKIEVVSTVDEQRLKTVIASAQEAADVTIRRLEQGEFADANAAAAAFLRYRLDQLQRD